MDELKLIDNTDRSQYEFHIEGYIPKIEYIKRIPNEIFLTHTEVPVELEGRGIGSKLVEEVLGDIERQGFKLIPLCPFVLSYIRKNPEWERLVARY